MALPFSRLPAASVAPSLMRPRSPLLRRRANTSSGHGPLARFVQQRFVGVWVLDLLEMLPGHGWQDAEQRSDAHRWRRGCQSCWRRSPDRPNDDSLSNEPPGRAYAFCTASARLEHRGSRNAHVVRWASVWRSGGRGATRGRRDSAAGRHPSSRLPGLREARSQKLSCGQNERKRSSDRTPSDLARDECSSRRVSFGVRSCLSARRRSDCKRRFVFWACALVGGFAAGFGFWFSFLRARFFDDSRCLDVIVLGLPKGTRGTA